MKNYTDDLQNWFSKIHHIVILAYTRCRTPAPRLPSSSNLAWKVPRSWILGKRAKLQIFGQVQISNCLNKCIVSCGHMKVGFNCWSACQNCVVDLWKRSDKALYIRGRHTGQKICHWHKSWISKEYNWSKWSFCIVFFIFWLSCFHFIHRINNI